MFATTVCVLNQPFDTLAFLIPLGKRQLSFSVLSVRGVRIVSFVPVRKLTMPELFLKRRGRTEVNAIRTLCGKKKT